MIKKKIKVKLTQEEIDSPESIEIIIKVFKKGEKDDAVNYTISYPKTTKSDGSK